MTSDERHGSLLAAAALLFANGQSTSMTQTAVTRLNQGLGIDAVLIPSWSMLTLKGTHDTVLTAAVSPTGINMRRVASMMTVIDRARDGQLDLQTVKRGVAHAESEVGSGTAVFALACATGAAALAVIFGATQPLVVLLAAVGAAAGGLLRRWLGIGGAGPLVQLFAAALLGGVLGAVAAHLHLGGSTALVAICQAMVLVPGAHILNGALDLLDLRVTLGLARLGFAALLLTAISGGLMVGLALGGQTLAVTAPSSSAPFYVDVIAAGVAAASYPVYFSMPWPMIGWPVVVGMSAHAVHWWALERGVSLAVAALLSCLLVGSILVPVAHYMRIPFAAVGFASVVALVPGLFVFRTLSGLAQFADAPSPALLSAAASNLIVASITVTGMALGLALPMHVFTGVWRRRHEL
jgi:uncharacterized membrane protein YjjP (DUF1212 family)